MKCENKDCESGRDVEEVLRLTSFHGHFQNPMRIGSRTPARIGVCRDCAMVLCNDTELKWKSEGEFKGRLNAEGSFSIS